MESAIYKSFLKKSLGLAHKPVRSGSRLVFNVHPFAFLSALNGRAIRILHTPDCIFLAAISSA